VDKGEAVRLLKALLGVRHVVYMGDSENDLPAWREADVKVLISHSLNRGLHVPGTIPVKYVDLPSYLEEAARNMTSA
jgi:phosphoserine phosphatase